MEFIESLYDNINRSTYGSAWKWYETIEEIEYRAPFKKIKNNYYCEYCEKKDKYLNAKRVYEDYKQNEETCPDMLNQLWYMWIDRKLDMKLHGEPCDCLIRWERDQHGLVFIYYYYYYYYYYFSFYFDRLRRRNPKILFLLIPLKIFP